MRRSADEAGGGLPDGPASSMISLNVLRRVKRARGGDARHPRVPSWPLLRPALVLAGVLAVGIGLRAAEPEEPDATELKLQRAAAMALLSEGNKRFVAGEPRHPNTDADRRKATVADGQEPFATVLACSDSRDPVELIFDRGVGDLFVVRVAGNVAGTSELATLEYGVGHLHTPLVVVMGHSKCGAVTAVAQGARVHGHLVKLAQRIKPAVDQVKSEGVTREGLVPRAVEENIRQTIAGILRESEELREFVETGRVQIVGALYDLEAGTVQWLGPHPKQAAILAEIKAARPEVLGEAMHRTGAPQSAGTVDFRPPTPAGARPSEHH